ncbi:MAG: tetratricopeptide repeat protein [Cyclobacteriaceae bacterium]
MYLTRKKQLSMWKRSFSLFMHFICVLSMAQESVLESAYKAERFDEVITIADSILSKGEVEHPRFHHLLADSYYYEGELQQSLESYLEAIFYYERGLEGSLRSKVECYSHTGFCYRELGLYNKAFPHYRQSLQLAFQLKDSLEIATQYYNLATLYEAMGDYEFAVRVLDSAYTIDRIRKDTMALGFDLSLMSAINQKLGNTRMALENARESLNLLRPGDGNRNSSALRKNDLGVAYLGVGSLDSAKYYLEVAEQELVQLNDSNSLARNWLEQARLYQQLEDTDKTLELAQQVLSFTQGQTNEFTVRATLSIVEVYIQMLLYQKVQSILRANEQQCEELGLMPELLRNLNLQQQVNKSLNGIEGGKEIEQKINELQEMMDIEDNRVKMELINLQYKFDKIEERNKILSERKNQLANVAEERRYWLIQVVVGSGIAIVLLIITILVYRSRKLAREKVLLAEIDNLRGQIKSVFEGDTSQIDLNIDRLNKQIPSPLTEREFEILNLAIGDLNNSQIANQVSISINTVKFHLKKIYGKLGVTNRKEALNFAIQSS